MNEKICDIKFCNSKVEVNRHKCSTHIYRIKHGLPLFPSPCRWCGRTPSKNIRTCCQCVRSEYKIWASMLYRVRSPKHCSYKYYGDRGVSICDRWKASFDNFFEDMGPRPSLKYSIDRINNYGNYEPGNCRWATASQQSCNTRSNVFLTYKGKTQTIMEWSRESGIQKETLRHRFKKGLPLEVVFCKNRINPWGNKAKRSSSGCVQ